MRQYDAPKTMSDEDKGSFLKLDGRSIKTSNIVIEFTEHLPPWCPEHS